MMNSIRGVAGDDALESGAALSVLLLLAGGVLIGALLALLGAGGSILLLPLLVSGLALPLREAVPLSLLVVLLLALANLIPALRQGRVAWRPALWLGSPALAGSWVGAGWVRSGVIPPSLQLMLFALAAATAAWLMLRERKIPEAAPSRDGRVQLLVQGLGVGLLTGIAGVGGGFAIVPALVLLARLPMTQASGTSLLVICASSLMALIRHGHWPAASLPLLLPLLLGGGIGILLGQRWVSRVSERRLRQGFAALLLVSAITAGFEALQPQSPSTEVALSNSTRFPQA